MASMLRISASSLFHRKKKKQALKLFPNPRHSPEFSLYNNINGCSYRRLKANKNIHFVPTYNRKVSLPELQEIAQGYHLRTSVNQLRQDTS